MGCYRKIIPIWILFVGCLIGSCVEAIGDENLLQPQGSILEPNENTNGYIKSSCYDQFRKIAFIGTTAVDAESHVITFENGTFGTSVPIEKVSSLDICIFDPANTAVYFVASSPQLTTNAPIAFIVRVDVSSPNLTTNAVSYAQLQGYAARVDKVNFGFLVEENVIGLVGDAFVTIPVDQLNFTSTAAYDTSLANTNTELVTIFSANNYLSFVAGFADGTTGYFVSSETPARILAVDLTVTGNPGIDQENQLSAINEGSLTISPVKDCVYDSDRKLAYCWDAIHGQPSTVAKVDVTTCTQTARLKLAANSKEMTVAVLDTQHGQMYIGGGDSAPASAYVSQINLNTFTLNPAKDVAMLSGQKYLRIGWLSDDQTLYFGYGYPAVNISNVAYAGVFPAILPAVCPGTPECSGRGSCVYGACVCDALTPADETLFPDSDAYAGSACETVNCKYDCTNNVTGFQGTCNAGLCDCGANYTGTFCEIQRCPYNCSGRGVCNEASFICQCDGGWTGSGCETQAPTPCSSYKNCRDCLGDTSCGWCRSEGKCTEGDLNGPFEAGESGCTSWYFTQCPEVGMEFFGYLFTVLAGIMLLMNMVSLVQEESNPLLQNRTSDLDIRETWWRNQRSVKTWLMIDEIQFAAITAMFAVNSPSLYFNFVTIFRWSVIGFPLPWSQRDFNTGRDTLSMDQYSSSILAKDTEVFFGSLFWFALLLLFAVVVFLVLRLFGRICFNSDYGLRNFFRNRLVYTLVRIAMFAYFPFAVFTTYSFTVDSAAAIVISIIFLLVVHLPLAIFLWRIQPKTKKDSTKLFRPEFLTRYGCLYHSFYVKRAWFQEVVFLRKLAMGAIVGLLQGFQTVQLVLLLIIQAGYLVAVLTLQPFLDSMHMFIEIASCIGHLIMIALMFPFIESLDLDLTDDVAVFLSVAIAAISLILQLICIGGFINNWMKMNNIASFMDLVDRCRGGKGSGNSVDVELDMTRSKQK